MGNIEDLEARVRALTPEEFARFREWVARFDAEVWDRQFEADVAAGRLDSVAQRALRDHAAGKSTLKKVGRFWSVRIGLYHRALAVETPDGLPWFWGGNHPEYEKLID